VPGRNKRVVTIHHFLFSVMYRIHPITKRRVCGSYHCDKSRRLYLDGTDNSYYCHKHITHPETREYSQDPQRRIFNRKKERLCDSYGCTRKDIHPHRGGLFCPVHQHHIDELRQRIQPHLGTVDEIYARFVELHFRKRYDPGHWTYCVQWVSDNKDNLEILLATMEYNSVFKDFSDFYEPVATTIWSIARDL
jgi:hypothetical protein